MEFLMNAAREVLCNKTFFLAMPGGRKNSAITRMRRHAAIAR
jgi:hypothetical protein